MNNSESPHDTPAANGVAERMSLRRMLDEFVEVILLEKGFLYTTKELFLRPGITIRRVLDGERATLNPPLRFMFISVTVIAIAMNLTADSIYIEMNEVKLSKDTATKIAGLSEELQECISSKENDGELRFRASRALTVLHKSTAQHILELFYSWNNVVLTLAVPIYALGTFLIFRQGFNFAEHLAINAYIHGAQCTMTFATLPLGIAGWPTLGSIVYVVISFAYQLWAWAHVLQLRSLWEWILAPVLILVSLTVYMLLGLVLIACVTVWTFWSILPTTNIDQVERPVAAMVQIHHNEAAPAQIQTLKSADQFARNQTTVAA